MEIFVDRSGKPYLTNYGAELTITGLCPVCFELTENEKEIEELELGPLVTAIVVAGRSGAGLASEIATMKVSEEIDAFWRSGQLQSSDRWHRALAVLTVGTAPNVPYPCRKVVSKTPRPLVTFDPATNG